MQIISKVALITINETMVIQIISFLVFMFIMNRIMFRPLRDTMSERHNYLRDIQKEIGDAEIEIEAITNQLREQESNTRFEANDMAKSKEDAGKLEAGEILATARKEIAGLMEQTRKDIDAQIMEVRKTIKIEAESLAITVMEKVLDRRLIS